MAWHAFTPEIFATAYHSLVGSKESVNKYSSLNGCEANLGYIQELPKNINLSTPEFSAPFIRLF